MKKQYWGWGLAAFLWLGYCYFHSSDTPQAKTISTATVTPPPAEVKGRIRRRISLPVTLSLAPSQEQDEYRALIRNLEIVPPLLYEKPDEDECDPDELMDTHNYALATIANGEYKNLPRGTPDHNLWDLMKGAIRMDAVSANCFLDPDSKEYHQKTLEIVHHYERLQSWGEAARVYYYLYTLSDQQGYLEKARELFSKTSLDEERIALTSLEGLSTLRDEALRKGGNLLAGKIEWLLGNKDKARALITQGEGFSGVLGSIREKIQERLYFLAIDYPGGSLKIPFYREIITAECRENAECLEELRQYTMKYSH